MMQTNEGIFDEIEQAEAEKQRAELERQKTENSIKSVMEAASGRRFIWWLFAVTGVDQSVTSLDPAKMMHDSAQRDIGLHVKESIEALGLREQLEKMRTENE